MSRSCRGRGARGPGRSRCGGSGRRPRVQRWRPPCPCGCQRTCSSRPSGWGGESRRPGGRMSPASTFQRISAWSISREPARRDHETPAIRLSHPLEKIGGQARHGTGVVDVGMVGRFAARVTTTGETAAKIATARTGAERRMWFSRCFWRSEYVAVVLGGRFRRHTSLPQRAYGGRAERNPVPATPSKTSLGVLSGGFANGRRLRIN